MTAAVVTVLLSLRRVRRLVRSAEAVSDQTWQDAAATIGAQLGVRHPVRLLVSNDVSTPMAGGVWRPARLVTRPPDGVTDTTPALQPAPGGPRPPPLHPPHSAAPRPPGPPRLPPPTQPAPRAPPPPPHLPRPHLTRTRTRLHPSHRK